MSGGRSDVPAPAPAGEGGRRRGPDPVALAGAVAVGAPACLFVAVASGAMEVPFGWAAPILTAAIALVLIAIGLSGEER